MRLDVGGIDRGCGGNNPAGPAQRIEDILPHTLLAPAVEPIVDRRVGAVFDRTVAPSGAGLQHVNDAGNHPAIINPVRAATTTGQPRLNPRPLIVTQPEQMPHRKTSNPKIELNHDCNIKGIH